MQRRDRIIREATGLHELGLHQEAWDALESLEPEERALPTVGEMRLSIFVALKKWESAALLALGMHAAGNRGGPVYLLGAYAIRRGRSLAEAQRFLQQGEAVLGEDPTFHFNLACYACQLGDMQTAKERLDVAFTMAPELRLAALEDEDLAPLWEAL